MEYMNIEELFENEETLLEEEMEFPTKDRRRANRRKKAVAKGRRRMAVRNAKCTDYERQTKAHGKNSDYAKAKSKFYYASSPKRGDLLATARDIYSNPEAIAPAGARRRMEAMKQEEAAYKTSVLRGDVLSGLDELVDDVIFYCGDSDYAPDVETATKIAIRYYKRYGRNFDADLVEEVINEVAA